MLCKGKAYRHFIWETLLKPEARREAGEGWGEGGWDGGWDLGSSGKHPRERQEPSLKGGRNRTKCGRFQRRNEITEKWALWTDPSLGLGAGVDLCYSWCFWGAWLGQPSTSTGHLRLNEGGLVSSGRGRAGPGDVVSEANSCYFL